MAPTTPTPCPTELDGDAGAALDEVPAILMVGVVVGGLMEEGSRRRKGEYRLHGTLTCDSLVSVAAGAGYIVAELRIV